MTSSARPREPALCGECGEVEVWRLKFCPECRQRRVKAQKAAYHRKHKEQLQAARREAYKP